MRKLEIVESPNKMKNSYYIYKHTFPNNKVYIGITSKKPEYRWGKEGKEYWYSNRKMFYAIKKYGWNNIIHDILFNNLTKEEAHKKEIELIELYNSTDSKMGYNLSTGGHGFNGLKHTNETKTKISVAIKEHFSSDEARQRLRDSHKGKVHTEEEKTKIRDAQIQRMKSIEAREKIGLSLKNKIVSETTKQKMSASAKLRGISKQTLEGNIKAVNQFDLSGKFIKHWKQMRQASNELNISIGNISSVCSGKRKTAGGFMWKYAE